MCVCVCFNIIFVVLHCRTNKLEYAINKYKINDLHFNNKFAATLYFAASADVDALCWPKSSAKRAKQRSGSDSNREAEQKSGSERARQRERASLKIFGGRQGSGTCVQAAKSKSRVCMFVCGCVCVLSWQLERGRALRKVLFLFVAFVLAVVTVVVALASTDQAHQELDQLLLCFDERGRGERESARVGVRV